MRNGQGLEIFVDVSVELVKLIYVRRILDDKKFVLPATDGEDFIGKRDGIINYVDPNFKIYDCSVTSQSSIETEVQVYEVVKDGTFANIFGWFGPDIDCLCLTQAQIKKFVQHHRGALCTEGRATFFVFKVGNEFLVAHVYLNIDESLGVYVYHFAHVDVWRAAHRHRVVVPKSESAILPGSSA